MYSAILCSLIINQKMYPYETLNNTYLGISFAVAFLYIINDMFNDFRKMYCIIVYILLGISIASIFMWMTQMGFNTSSPIMIVFMGIIIYLEIFIAIKILTVLEKGELSKQVDDNIKDSLKTTCINWTIFVYQLIFITLIIYLPLTKLIVS